MKNFHSVVKYKVLHGLLLITLALALKPCMADDALVPHSAFYHVKIKVAKGTMATTLANTASGYIGTSRLTPRGWARIFSRGVIEGRSEFSISEFGLRPAEFHQIDTVAKKDGLTRLNFDWEDMSLTGEISYREKRRPVSTPVEEAITSGSYDPISLQYALMSDLINDTLKSNYILVDREDQKVIAIRRLESTQIATPYGEFEVIPVQHQAEQSSRVTTFWFAPALDYLPVKIQQDKGSKQLIVALLVDYLPVAPN